MLAEAQTPVSKPSPPIKIAYAKGKSAAPNESEDILRLQRRDQAISLITSLAKEARAFRDPMQRARIQARAADALWETNKEHASVLFHDAWDAAEVVDRDGAALAKEARKKTPPKRGEIMMIPPAPNLRAEVLRLAAQRSRALGEDFLKRLNETTLEEKDTTTTGNDTAFSDPTEPSLAIAKRLELAKQLLDIGNIEQALQFADPALNSVTSQGILFLSALREKNALQADQRYAFLLKRAAIDPLADATSVSLLSSYIFTPSLLVTVTRHGRLLNQWRESKSAPVLPLALRADFFTVAAQILLRPVPVEAQDHTAAGRAGTYFTIARLLPLFDLYAPDKSASLRAQLNALAPDAPETFRTGQDSLLSVGLSSEAPAKDEIQDALDQLTDASSSADRDAIYADASRAAVMKADPRARAFADQIDDEALRSRVRSFVDVVNVKQAIERKDVKEALRIIRDDKISHLQRVWAYTNVARLLKPSDRLQAIQLLDESAVESLRIETENPERVYALIATASQFFEIDHTRSWELT
jgi:hypothetical protein